MVVEGASPMRGPSAACISGGVILAKTALGRRHCNAAYRALRFDQRKRGMGR